MKRILLLTIVLSSFILLPKAVFSQMFSVGDAQQQQSFPNSFLRIGTGPATFDYMGNDLSPFGSTLLEFDSNALFVNFETPGLNLALLLANNITGLEEKNYFDLGFTLTNKFALIRRPFITVGLPIQLYSSVTNINNDRAQENFNQVNFGFGGGGFLNLKLGKRITLNNELIPGYGFSNSNGGFFGGSVFYVTGKSRLTFVNLLGRRSVSLGYDFNYRSFDIDGELYDFELKSNLLTIGISL